MDLHGDKFNKKYLSKRGTMASFGNDGAFGSPVQDDVARYI